MSVIYSAHSRDDLRFFNFKIILIILESSFAKNKRIVPSLPLNLNGTLKSRETLEQTKI